MEEAEWLATLSPGERLLVDPLLRENKVHYWGGDPDPEARCPPGLYVDCSDTFVWGCGDSEPITIAELPALTECFALSPRYGDELWCARKRGMRPQGASYQECYPPAEWPLFDACGPPRPAVFGNPIDRDTLTTADAWAGKGRPRVSLARRLWRSLLWRCLRRWA